MARSVQRFVALAATLLLAALTPAPHNVLVAATGVCYSPFHDERYFSDPSAIKRVLADDMQHIARSTNFAAVRTYHAQFYGASVGDAAHAAGLQVAIGIQMIGDHDAPYAYLADDIDAAVAAAIAHPESVLAIYAGNENLRNGAFGASSADDIIAVITHVKQALAGTKAAHVPVGTVQRLEEWLHASGADRLAEVCDVAGVNIYPFFTRGGERDMKGALASQWTLATAKLGAKARLTETGWPTHGSISDAGNTPTVANAQSYFSEFATWAATNVQTQDAFYFMMFDLLSAHATDYEQHFGVATASGQLKFPLKDVLAQAASTSRSISNNSNNNTVANGGGKPNATSATNTSPAKPIVTTASSSIKTIKTSGNDVDDDIAGESDRSLDAGFAPLEPSTTSSKAKPASPTTAWPVVTTQTPTETQTPMPTVVVVASSAIGNALSTATGPTVESSTLVTAPTTVTSKPLLPHSAGSSALDGTAGSGPGGMNEMNVGNGSGSSGIGIGGSGSNGTNTVPKSDPDVGDVVIRPPNAPVAAPDVANSATFAPAASTAAISKAKEQEILAQEARAKNERIVAGNQSMGVQVITIAIGLAGVATIVVAAVYMQKRRHERENRLSITAVDARESTPSVYNDPLGTRFSSIVMITPNGDGVCIL